MSETARREPRCAGTAAVYQRLVRRHDALTPVLNNMRTGFRVVYSACLITLSSDGLTHSKRVSLWQSWTDSQINMSDFARDALLVVG